MILRGVVVLAVLAGLLAASGCGSNGSLRPVPSQSSTSTPAAPPSTPPTPPPSTSATPAGPSAKDGQNYKACNDGTCEVLIRRRAVLVLNGTKSTATVADGELKITDANGYVSLGGVGPVVSWSGASGPLHIATLKYAEGDTVVVILTKG